MRHVNWNTALAGCALSAATMLAIATGCKTSSATEAHGDDATAPETSQVAHHIDGKTFVIDATPDGDCRAGAECHVVIKLQATGDYHINKEYPYKFKGEAAGVEFLGSDAAGKNTFSKSAGDLVIDNADPPKNAMMTVKFKPAARGTATVKGTFKMSVCSAQNCQLETQDISVDVPVK